MPWRPLSAREAEQVFEETLFEGVPGHLASALREWLEEATDEACRRRIAALTRTSDLPSGNRMFCDWVSDEVAGDLLLDLIDAVLHVGPAPQFSALHPPKVLIRQLDELLTDGGSVYHVRADACGLERRIAPEIADAASHAIARAEAGTPSAAKHLAAAWQAAYGLHPNPTLAYSEAVKAVEAALIPLVQPKHAKATLGTVLGELRAKADRWRFAIDHGPSRDGNIAPVIAMAEMLWTGQTDRHATNGPTRTTSVPAAESALFVAIPLVQWAQSGALTRR